MLDAQFFGVKPAGHHVTSLILHALNSLLLFLILLRMTGAVWRSTVVAGLFAVHPMHVESVAWISERKDVLSTLFWMLTVWAYVGYVRRPGLRQYAVVAGLFALGLMSKPMLVTLPLVLLLLDFWPLRRLNGRMTLWPLVREKIPLAALAVTSSAITITVQHRAVSGLDALPISLRLANAAVAYVRYIGKMLWPARLALFYPFDQQLSIWAGAASAVLLALVSYAALKAARSFPYLAAGWFWFLGTLLPVIGLIQVGGQSMADRYTYVPFIGLFIAAVWGAAELAGKHDWLRASIPVAAIVVLAGCSMAARAQAQHWTTNRELWSHAVEVTSGNYFAHGNLGSILLEQGKVSEAVAHFSEALRIKPDSPDAYNKLGTILADQGKLVEAIENYRAALRFNPDFVEAHGNIANALARQGNSQEAIQHYAEALRLRPDYAEAHNGWGSLLEDQGNRAEAIEHYREALRLRPEFADVRNNLGTLLAGQGKLDEAIQQLQEAVRIRPDSPDFRFNLALLLKAKGDVNGAVAELQLALRIQPGYSNAQRALRELRGRQ